MPTCIMGLKACLRFLLLSAGVLIASISPAQTYLLPDAESSIIGEECEVIAREQDTLLDIARNHDVGYTQIVAANPDVHPWVPEEGTRIVVPKRHILPEAPRRGIVVNTGAMRLFYFPDIAEDGTQQVITYPIGIGREGWDTPEVATKVRARAKDPTWTVPESIRKEHALAGDPLPRIVPPGPKNPLGKYAILLDVPGYLIHGTNKPYGAGMRISHGCIRLNPEDIEDLIQRVQIGTPVHIVDQPFLVAWDKGSLFVEAHPVLEEDGTMIKHEIAPVVPAIIRTTRDQQLTEADWKRIKHVAGSQHARPEPVAQGKDKRATKLRKCPQG